MKYTIIALLYTLGIPLYMNAKEIADTIRPPIINLHEDDFVFNNKESINLNRTIIVHPQLDSVLKEITDGLKENSNLCFYITFMKNEDKLYFEIFEDYPNDYLFNIRNGGGALSQRLNCKIYGYVKYNNIDIYLLLVPGSYEPTKDILQNLICKTKDRIVIYRKPKEYHFVQENPMWLYEYSKGDINLINSVNDKGFFTNP